MTQDETGNNFVMKLDIPVGSTATVYVPAGSAGEVKETGSTIKKKNKNITFTGMEDIYMVFRVNSGSYVFSSEN